MDLKMNNNKSINPIVVEQFLKSNYLRAICSLLICSAKDL